MLSRQRAAAASGMAAGGGGGAERKINLNETLTLAGPIRPPRVGTRQNFNPTLPATQAAFIA
jgi:hypothetical protein